MCLNCALYTRYILKVLGTKSSVKVPNAGFSFIVYMEWIVTMILKTLLLNAAKRLVKKVFIDFKLATR